MKAKPLPEFMTSKIAESAFELQKVLGLPSLAAAIGQIEVEAAVLLRAELSQWPALAELVPSDFLKLLKEGSYSVMTTYERAAIVVVNIDAQAITFAVSLEIL